MLRSMTGFAQASGHEEPWSLTVTVRALNHRFLDLHLRLPPELEVIEPRLRSLVRRHVHRGHLDVRFQWEQNGPRALQVDRPFVEHYLELYGQLSKEFGIGGEPDLGVVLRMPGVLRRAEMNLNREGASRLADLAECTLKEALLQVNEMRCAEGAALAREVQERLQRIGQLREGLTDLNARATPTCQQRLRTRLSDLLSDSEIDPARLAQEAAYLAERADVSEELTRLLSHLDQLGQLLQSDSPVGKQMDFLLQEMNREANTILSKVSNLGEEGLEMTRLGLEVKAEIERLREQAQNVE